MQVPSPVPQSIERFVRERLPSVEQIEIVLLLRAQPDRAWTAPEVAQHLGTPPESTAMRLFLLASNGLLAFEGGGVPRYRYGADATLDALVAELAGIYETDRAALTPVIGAPVIDPLRSFADAFKLKK